MLTAELGVSDKIANLCIYHLEQDRMKRIYIRADMQETMRAAWLTLGARLELLTRPDLGNVVTLKRRAA